MEPDTICIYHGGCTDGFCAAWIVRRAFPGEAITFLSAQYGDTPPNVKGKKVIIVDFSYPRETLLKMHADATRLVVYDHHKTAQKDLEGLDFCVFDMDQSGATLTYQYVIGSAEFLKPALWITHAVEDNDLWRFARPYTREIVLALRATPQTFEEWNKFEIRGREVAIEQGKAILSFQNEQVKKAMSNMILTDVTGVGHKVPTVNSCLFQSEIGHELLKKYTKAPYSVVWYYKEGKILLSLRSMDDRADVSAIAKQFGGGGHRNAAGCSVTPEFFFGPR